MSRDGRAIVRRVVRDAALRDGAHVHTVSYSYDEICQGGDSECLLWALQLEEAIEVWK